MTGERIKVLVTGANGQLGREILNLPVPKDIEIIGFGRQMLDVTDKASCRQAIRNIKPNVIIHCAAYTAVDKAESEPEAAFAVNEEGTRNIAEIAEELSAKFVYISTDYVFNGQGKRPYTEEDEPDPQTVYGKSKLAGEQWTRTLNSRFFIVRTSWVFGRYGQNFVKTMLRLAEERDEIRVVGDQYGSPTYAYDLAQSLIELIRTERYGIYHVSNTGFCSWYEFAATIFAESRLTIRLESCTTEEFPRPAPRPAYSVMSHDALCSEGFKPLRHWKEALKHYLRGQ